MKVLKRITFITVCISILYLVLSNRLSFTERAFRMWADTWRNIPQLAVYAMTGKVIDSTENIYWENLGELSFLFGDNKDDYTGTYYFDDENRFGGEHQTNLESVIRTAYQQKYDGKKGRLREEHKRRTSTVWNDDKEEESASYTEEKDSKVGTDYREKAAKIVYDAVLAAEGYSYEVCYNAKGNLYIDLGSKTSDEDGQKTYYYRLVYDRSSKNGACELFVLYRSTEPWDNEVIVDMYAVENDTGKVAASGRKAWSDVGTKEYREMTGE